MLCTGDFCDKKDTCANYFRNADMSEPCEVESFATFGSAHTYTDANGSHVVEDEIWCGPNGHYKRYKENLIPMKSCKIKLKNFKAMVDAVKDITASEGEKYGREVLKFIQLTVTKENIVAVSCNGYQLSKYTLSQSNEEEFTCYFKPFYFRVFQWMEDTDIVVNFDEEKRLVSIKMPANFGSINYEFTQPSEKYPVLPVETLEKAKENANRIFAVDPVRLKLSSKGFIKGKRNYMEVFAPKDELSPIFCKTKFSEIESLEHIILPVRI